jgi:hypothetical protein
MPTDVGPNSRHRRFHRYKRWRNPESRVCLIVSGGTSARPYSLTRGPSTRYLGSMLLFKKKFLSAIRAGEKTQTIRLWKYCRMRAGQRSYIPGVGYIRVTAGDQVELARLTDADARPDGFETADALRAEIARLYPQQIAEGYQAYRIAFRIATPEEADEATRQKRGEKKAKEV